MISLAFALLTGCSDPSAIWLVRVEYDADAGVECDAEISENFIDGDPPEAEEPDVDSEWTYEQSTIGSDSLLFMQVETTAAGEGVLVWGGDVIPGLKNQDGTWTFSWVEESGGEERSEHESGYRFIEETYSASEVKVDLTFDTADTLSGKLTASSTEAMTWKESDNYGDGAEDYVGLSGQIPSEDYLVYEDDGNEFPQSNEFEEDDCDGPECEITVGTYCEGTNTFTATRTDYQEEDAYAYLQAY